MRVLIIGSGTMGAGIAQWLSQNNVTTFLYDINHELLQKSYKEIHDSWDKLVQKKKFTEKDLGIFKNNLNKSEQLEIPNIDLIIECVIEDLNIKKDIFKNLLTFYTGNEIFASNTSSLSISELSLAFPKERRKNFLGIHFFNPAPIMKLVEVIESPYTDAKITEKIVNWFKERGKKTALCKDTPGFIVNRIARNFYGESLKILKRDNMSEVENIDTILKDCASLKMGPFKLLDLIGIDTNLKVSETVWKDLYYPDRLRPTSLQRKMVESNKLGIKSKSGFYDYNNEY